MFSISLPVRALTLTCVNLSHGGAGTSKTESLAHAGLIHLCCDVKVMFLSPIKRSVPDLLKHFLDVVKDFLKLEDDDRILRRILLVRSILYQRRI